MSNEAQSVNYKALVATLNEQEADWKSNVDELVEWLVDYRCPVSRCAVCRWADIDENFERVRCADCGRKVRACLSCVSYCHVVPLDEDCCPACMKKRAAAATGGDHL
jgi:hypothetical protein